MQAISGIMDSAKNLVARSWGSYQYTALAEPATAEERQVARKERNRRILKFVIVAALIPVALFAIATLSQATPASGSTPAKSCDSVKHGYKCKPSISQHWGQYSPWFSVPSTETSDPTIVPDGCRVTFVQLLSRHGARDPTASKTAAYNATVARIQANASSYGKDLEFLEKFVYRLGANELTAFGEQEMINSGVKFFRRYRDLVGASTSGAAAQPFVRASGQNRVVVSAQNWTQGLHAARARDARKGRAGGKGSGGEVEPDGYPWPILVIPEESGSNNTLNHGLCTAFETGTYSTVGDEAQQAWAAVFTPPITARLNAALPGADLSAQDTINLMDMCPFSTAAHRTGRPSRFCALFSRDEWLSYDYYQTLGKWYGYGPGNPLGPTQGVGFANELAARLTRRPVRDQTTTNATLDGRPETFPLDRAVYADFSHDNDMTAVFGALGLFDGTVSDDMLPTTERRADARNETGGYSAAWTVPFAARMYVEKMACAGGGGGKGGQEDEELVRVVLNDRVVPLRGCAADDLGRCTLGSFVDSLAFARSGGRWRECFE